MTYSRILWKWIWILRFILKMMMMTSSYFWALENKKHRLSHKIHLPKQWNTLLKHLQLHKGFDDDHYFMLALSSKIVLKKRSAKSSNWYQNRHLLLLSFINLISHAFQSSEFDTWWPNHATSCEKRRTKHMIFLPLFHHTGQFNSILSHFFSLYLLSRYSVIFKYFLSSF